MLSTSFVVFPEVFPFTLLDANKGDTLAMGLPLPDVMQLLCMVLLWDLK